MAVKAQSTISLASVKTVNDASQFAVQKAEEAKTSAENASEYASRALGNLSTVQSVTETLNWITAHGTMTLTADTALDPTHVYFIRDNNGDYVVGAYHYSIVTEPSLSDISTYYELSIDESLNNYVGTHLALTSEGLWLIPDTNGNKVLIATGANAGTYIIGKDNGSDVTVASFTSESAVLGEDTGTHAEVTPNAFTLIDKDGNPYFEVKDWIDKDGYTIYQFTGDGTSRYFYCGVPATSTSAVTVTVDGETATASVTSANPVIVAFQTAPASGAEIEIKYTPVAGNYKDLTYGTRTAKDNRYFGVTFGDGLVVGANGQIAIGKYNHVDSGAFVVGIGSSDSNRVTAFRVDWNGNIYCNNSNGDVWDLLYLINPAYGYIETSSRLFNPADIWGGTWEKETIKNVHVVDEGIENNWRYVKYSDGRFEMDRVYNGAPTTGTHYATVGNLYGYRVSGISFPPSCKPINTDYHVDDTWIVGNGFTMSSGTSASKTTSSFGVYCLATVSGITSVNVNIHVTGLWDEVIGTSGVVMPDTIYRWHRTL